MGCVLQCNSNPEARGRRQDGQGAAAPSHPSVRATAMREGGHGVYRRFVLCPQRLVRVSGPVSLLSHSTSTGEKHSKPKTETPKHRGCLAGLIFPPFALAERVPA